MTIVRKLRSAGMPQAEAVGEVLSELPTRAEMREEIQASEKRMELKLELALARQFQKTIWLTISVQAFSVALQTFVITIIFLFLK